MDDFVWSWTQNGVDQFSNCDNAFVSPRVNQFSDSDCGGGVGGSGGSKGDDGRVGSASKNHSEAEKRRRDRINAHLATLRKLVSTSEKAINTGGREGYSTLATLLDDRQKLAFECAGALLISLLPLSQSSPNLQRTDKATLLGKVIEHVKRMNSETKDLSKVFTIPTYLDEVIIDHDLNTVDPNTDVFIRATVCCEDRPELFSEIKHALKSLRLTMVQADMTCLGGRILCNFILCVTNNTNKDEITTLKESLKLLLGRIVASSSWAMSSNYRIRSKRQRFFCSNNYDTNSCC